MSDSCTGNPIRVLVLVTNLAVANGVSSFIMNYYRNLDQSKVKMDFVTYFDSPSPYIEEVEKNGGKVFVLPPIRKVAQHIQGCLEILNTHSYDVVHDNSLIVTFPMMLCAMIKRVPVRILHSHNSRLGETRAKEIRNRMVLPILKATATDYAACSKTAGHAMFQNKEFSIIPNVIEVDKYAFIEECRNEVRKRLEVENKFVVATVGRIAYQKNPFFAVDVFEDVLKVCPDTEYWWIGNGPLQGELEDYIAKKGLTQSIKLMGSREDVIDLYHAMDCFFLPSVFEGLGIVCIEAQALGLPCVLSDQVPKQVKFTNSVSFVSLNSERHEWVYSILQYQSVNRMGHEKELRGSEYSDFEAGKSIFEYYKRVICNGKRK